MRLLLGLAAATLLILPMSALADPVPQPAYTINPNGVPAGQVNDIQGLTLHWCDGSAVILPNGQNCTIRVVSKVQPLPVQVMNQTSPSGAAAASTATFSAPVAKTVSASAQLIGPNASRRWLSIIPTPAGASCFIDPSGGTASAASMPIPNGWSWSQTDPPPAGAVTAFCTSPTSLVTTEAN